MYYTATTHSSTSTRVQQYSCILPQLRIPLMLPAPTVGVNSFHFREKTRTAASWCTRSVSFRVFAVFRGSVLRLLPDSGILGVRYCGYSRVLPSISGVCPAGNASNGSMVILPVLAVFGPSLLLILRVLAVFRQSVLQYSA